MGDDIKLREEVAALRATMTEFNKNMEWLMKSELEGRKTPWGTVIAAALLVLTFYTFGQRPIEVEIKNHEGRLDRQGNFVVELAKKVEALQRHR